MVKIYSLEEIKLAFWSVFKEAGEIWFPYGDSAEEEKEAAVEDYWGEFLEELDKQPSETEY